MSVYIGRYVKFKNDLYKVAKIYKTDGDYLIYDYLAFDQKYREFISNDGRCKLEDVEFITKDEFTKIVMSWVTVLLEHYY